jgi:peptidoglycan-N-acetylglucosamine deacetylase
VSLIKARGHIIGNHGYDHLNGWTTSVSRYCIDIEKAAPFTSHVLFRPPYGRLRLSQYKKLKNKFKIVFWDIIAYDFERAFGSDNSLHILEKKMRPGSIIVLHDSPGSNAYEITEQFILFALGKGFRFDNSIF